MAPRSAPPCRTSTARCTPSTTSRPSSPPSWPPSSGTAPRAGTCLGCTLVAEDLPSERVVEVGEHFLVAVPFAARWPYAVDVRSRRHGVGRLGDLDDDAALELARLLAAVLDRFDGLWGFDLPYMLCVQEAPPADGLTGAAVPDWHLHVELLPPHRNPNRLKVARRRDGARRVHQRHIARAHRRCISGVESARTGLDRRGAAGDRAGALTAVTARAPTAGEPVR